MSVKGASLTRAVQVVAAALAVLVGLIGWQVYQRPVVTVVLPVRGNAAEVVYATGNVEPKSWAQVVALHRRRIVETCDCEGKRVKKGDVLARLDDVEERAVLTELQARRSTIKADADRIALLLKKNVATQVSYDEKLTQLKEIDARISAQNDRLYDLDLRAPADGVVLRSDATIGEIAGTGEKDVLFWVGEPNPLEIDADVNEEDIAKVALGQSVLLRHDGFPGLKLTAAVAHITPKGDPDTKTFSVTLALPDDTPLKIGMSVEANIIVKEVRDALIVPADAVIAGHVMTLDGNRIKRRAVSTGIRAAGGVEIASGLEPTARIVSPANAAFADGTLVRLKREPQR